jgi:mRNA interferase RelE/StbE
MVRVILRWTTTAKESLAKLPKKVRRGLLDKANELRDSSDPAGCHKPLIGPLQGFYRICYSRYRLIYSVEHEKLANGDTLQRIVLKFIAAGIRKEGDKKDIYRLALRLLELGIIEPDSEDAETDEPEP